MRTHRFLRTVLAALIVLQPASAAAQLVDAATTERVMAPIASEASRVARWARGLSLAEETLAHQEGLGYEFLLDELRLHLAQLDTASRALARAPRLARLLEAHDLAHRVVGDLVQIADGFRGCQTCAAPSRRVLTTIADSAGTAARRWFRLTPPLEAELSAAVELADRLGPPAPPRRRP